MCYFFWKNQVSYAERSAAISRQCIHLWMRWSRRDCGRCCGGGGGGIFVSYTEIRFPFFTKAVHVIFFFFFYLWKKDKYVRHVCFPILLTATPIFSSNIVVNNEYHGDDQMNAGEHCRPRISLSFHSLLIPSVPVLSWERGHNETGL